MKTKNNKENEEFYGDGQLHVFDYGENYPLAESYIVILPSGEAFISNGSCSSAYGVDSWMDCNISYSTQNEMEESFAQEHDGDEYIPHEIDLDSIPDELKTVILSYAKDSSCKTDYEDVKEFCK